MNSKSTYLSRRRFISSCMACSACMALAPATMGAAFSTVETSKRKIRVVYALHGAVQDRPDWPNKGFDFRPRMEQFNSVLKREFPSFTFITTLATGKEDAEKIVSTDKAENPDGYIVFQMNCWNQVVQTLAQTEKPVLYVDFPYGGSGGFLVYNAAFLRSHQANVGFVSSSDISGLISAVKCFGKVNGKDTANGFAAAVTGSRQKLTPPAGKVSCIKDPLPALSVEECRRKLKESKILAVQDENARVAEPVMGIPLEYIPFAEVNSAWQSADKEEARSVAEKWVKNAAQVIEVPFTELQNSAAMYLGMKSVLAKHGANAITMNCLGGFYGNHIHAYPCLGFFELNNQGLIGACECDIASAATMLAFTTLTEGRPGIISDPVIDTSRRQIIYAHCVAPNKMFGPEGPTNPYTIMTHSEDRQGAALRSQLPSGYLTTTLKIDNGRKEFIFHQAIAKGNDPDDRACRTKLCAEPVGDMEKLFTEWDRWGWHRVTFYGDLKDQVFEMADSMGWKVIEEA